EPGAVLADFYGVVAGRGPAEVRGQVNARLGGHAGAVVVPDSAQAGDEGLPSGAPPGGLQTADEQGDRNPAVDGEVLGRWLDLEGVVVHGLSEPLLASGIQLERLCGGEDGGARECGTELRKVAAVVAGRQQGDLETAPEADADAGELGKQFRRVRG